MIDFILGTWQCTPSDGFWSNQNPIDGERLLGKAVRMGVQSFDTAQGYGKGHTEQLLGKVLSRFPDRSFSVDTKAMPSTKDPIDLIQLSLSRLRIPRIDRFYLHWPRTGFDAASFIEGIARCKDIGLVGRIGICNAPLEYLGDLVRRLKTKGVALDCLQIPVSLLWTRGLGDTIGFCHDNGIEILAYSPMGMGLLSGKYRHAEDLDDARAGLFCFKEPCIHAFSRLLDTLERVSSQHGITCAQTALAWTASCGVDTMVLGARNETQLKTDVSALGIALDDGEFTELSKAADELSEGSKEVCDNIFSYSW